MDIPTNMTFSLRAFSLSRLSEEELKLKISVCGYEKVTVNKMENVDIT